MPGPLTLASLACVLLLAATAPTAIGAARRPHSYPHLQQDWEQLRRRCEAQGGACTSLESCSGIGDGITAAARENCVRRCMSPACYGWQYGGDALEEGEEDSSKGAAFRACVLREVREARAAAAGLPLQPRRTPGYMRWGG